jgi:NhaC family Na+:H+ antiporter
MSPLSDTTNLAPAMAGTDLFTHIRYMMITTVPSISLTLVIFLIIGFMYEFSDNAANVTNVLNEIKQNFNINPFLFIVPALLIYVIIKKVPPLPAILFGTLLGGLFAVIFQPDLIRSIAGLTGNYAKLSYIAVMKSMFTTIGIQTNDPVVNNLFTTRGMAGMLDTIWLILAAMVFGGVMDSAGLLLRISEWIIRFARNTGSLVASTIMTSIFFNITASDQYIAIVVPGRMYAKTYREKGYKPELLSRTLEDGGTVTSVLIPWNTCGATQSRVLGVPTFTYLPFCFFNIISPFMSVFIASIQYKIRRFTDEEKQQALSDYAKNETNQQ